MALDPSFRKTEEECRLAYERAGKPLFGKVWTYDELQNAERTRWGKPKKDTKDLKTPDNWPCDTVIDSTSKWVFWLPEGWMQGIRTSAAGKVLKCYFTPEGKRFWHKKDIEKYIGEMLPTVDPTEREASDGTTRIRYVTDEESIPSWPDEDPEWLPRDFKLCFRQLPSGTHKIYIPPGQMEGFLYHKSSAMDYLAGKKMNLSAFGSSKPMAEVMASATTKRKAVRCSNDEKDFEDIGLKVMIPTAVAASDVIKQLEERGFGKNPDLLQVTRSSTKPQTTLGIISGIYARGSGTINGKPYWQRIGRGLYIHWSKRLDRWQIGGASESGEGFAWCSAGGSNPPTAGATWNVLREAALQARKS